MFKWLITIAIVYFVYRWISGKPLLPPANRSRFEDPSDRFEDPSNRDTDYTDYEEVDED